MGRFGLPIQGYFFSKIMLYINMLVWYCCLVNEEMTTTEGICMKLIITMTNGPKQFFNVTVNADSICAGIEKAKKLYPHALWVHCEIVKQ